MKNLITVLLILCTSLLIGQTPYSIEMQFGCKTATPDETVLSLYTEDGTFLDQYTLDMTTTPITVLSSLNSSGILDVTASAVLPDPSGNTQSYFTTGITIDQSTGATQACHIGTYLCGGFVQSYPISCESIPLDQDCIFHSDAAWTYEDTFGECILEGTVDFVGTNGASIDLSCQQIRVTAVLILEDGSSTVLTEDVNWGFPLNPSIWGPNLFGTPAFQGFGFNPNDLVNQPITSASLEMEPFGCNSCLSGRTSVSPGANPCTNGIDYTFTEIYNDESKDSTVVYGDGVPVDTLVSCFGETVCTRNYVNIPSTDINAASDTTLEIISTIDVCGNLKKDTIKTWFESFCIDDNTCRVGFTEYRADAEQPQCYFVAEGEVLNFNADATIYDADGCKNAVDTNGDTLEVVGGTISNIVNAQQFGNFIVPSFGDWSFEVTGAPFQLIRNNDGQNMDFFVELDEMQIEVDTVCQPLCNPPITETTTTNPDASTGVATATFSITKLGSPVSCNECVSLIFEQSNGALIQQFDGLTCGTLSSLSNYNATWFPDGSETIEDGTTIQVNKKQMAIDLGLDGANADSWTIYIIAGGQCLGSESNCPNPSSQNEEGYICEILPLGFDNSKTLFDPNEVANNSFTTFQNATYINNYIGSVVSSDNANYMNTLTGQCNDGVNTFGFVTFAARDECDPLITALSLDNIVYTNLELQGSNGWGLMGGFSIFQTIESQTNFYDNIGLTNGLGYVHDPNDGAIGFNMTDCINRQGDFTVVTICSDDPIINWFEIQGCITNTTKDPNEGVIRFELTELNDLRY